MILIHTLLSDVSVFLELVVASALALHRRQSLAPDRATAGPPSGVSGGGGGAAGSGMATLVARSDTSARGTAVCLRGSPFCNPGGLQDSE